MAVLRQAALVAACVLLIVYLLVGSARAGERGAGYIYSPIYVPGTSTVWHANKDGTPVWAVMYAKQYEQTQFKLCGLFVGDGDVLLYYPEAGDGVEFHYDQPTALCITTTVSIGGGTVPLTLNVHLTQRGERAASVQWPNVFVGQAR